MKSFRSLTQRIDQWWRESLDTSHQMLEQARKQTVAQLVAQLVVQLRRCQELLQTDLKPTQAFNLTLRRATRKRPQPPILLILAVASLTSAIGYRLYNEPQLGVGTIAPQTLRAPASTRVVDTKTTEENRTAARIAAVPVLMVDASINQDIYQSLQRLIDRGTELRQAAGAFPFVNPSVLSTATQRYLRQAEEVEWNTTIAVVEGNLARGRAVVPHASSANDSDRDPAVPNVASPEVAILELQNYRQANSAEDFSALKEVILRSRQRYATAQQMLQEANESDNFFDTTVLNLSDTDWAQLGAAVRRALERILGQGIAPGVPNQLIETAVDMQLETSLPIEARALAQQMLLSIVQPNLIVDPEETKQRAEQAARDVKVVTVDIRRGEVIVKAGEPINQTDFVLLDHFGMSRRAINWLGLMGFAGLVSSAVMVFLAVERRFHPGLRLRDHLLILLLTLSAPLVIALKIPAANFPAIGLLVGSFYGSTVGITVVGLLSIILPIGMEVSTTGLVANAVGGLVGAMMAGRLRSREELALLGGAVGLTQGAVYLLLNLIISAASTPVWYVVLSTAALQSLMGIAWSIVALGISPYLEQLFDLVTSIRLAELSNPNRPLLQRLAAETPGTFQHTLFVATLAEAAARALGCNVELVRAGTLYHDIGKTHDPLGFIENQMGGPNKHDAIDDPWLSAAIIKKHVTEGLVMARRNRLPKAIQAFIPEHQGTMLISYFYYQAVQMAQADPTIQVNEADFRYDGPIPQSRETGIVMLADSCEAALRSLKDASPEQALSMVNRILRSRWQDNQLVDSGLTRSEMSQIADIFVQVWLQFNHQRIPYPKVVTGAR